MTNEYPLDLKKLREYNFRKYKGVPPSWALIKNVIEESGLKFMYKFELVFGIPHQSLKLYKNIHRGLPAIYWHIFYDFDSVRYNNVKSYSSKMVTKRLGKTVTVLGTNKSAINGIKQQLQLTG